MRLPFTDAHVHFYDLDEPGLEYFWLVPGGDEYETTIMGQYGAIRAERYWADDYLAETRFHNVARVIHVQCADGSEADSVVEARWLQTFHERLGVPHAIIGYADLAGPNVREVIEAHLEFDLFRGVRDPRTDAYLTDPRWEAGLAVLAEHELVCCDDPPIDQAKEAAALVARHPSVTYCLDHAIYPALHQEGDFERWREAIQTLAALPNTVIKISGLGMVDHAWTVDSLRDRVLACIEAFGVERSFFASNWPVDRLYASFGDVLDAYAAIVADFTEAEQRALFGENANRIFRVA